jgi:hypothetical protein
MTYGKCTIGTYGTRYRYGTGYVVDMRCDCHVLCYVPYDCTYPELYNFTYSSTLRVLLYRYN